MVMRAILLLALAASCLPAQSYTTDIAPIFESRCFGCHASKVKMGSLDLDSFDSLQQGGNHGKVITPGKSGESRLYLMIAGKASPAMPMDGSKLSPEQIDAIKNWIDAGATGPEPGAVHVKTASAVPRIQPRSPLKPQIFDLAYSPNGKLIALAGFQEIRLADPATKQIVAKLTGEADTIRALAFSPDGKLLAAAGGLPARSGEVKIWDVEQRKLVQTIHGHADCIYAVAFSPDGKSIATSSYDKLIKLWDAASGKEIRTFKDHIDAVYALAFTPDGKRLISGSADRTVKIWSAATGERLYTLSEPQDGINAIALDPAGRLIAAGGLDKSIRIWSLGEKTGKLEASLIAHEDAILRLAWSPDGKYLLSSSADKTVKLFRASDLTEIKSYPESDWVYGLQWSPDGKTFATGQFDGAWTVGQVSDLSGQVGDLPHNEGVIHGTTH